MLPRGRPWQNCISLCLQQAQRAEGVCGPSTLAWLAWPCGAVIANAATSCGPCAFSVAAPLGSWSGSSSHLISLPRSSSAWLWDQPLFPIQWPDSSSRLCQQTQAVWRFTSVDNLSFLVFVCFFKPRERAKICSMSLVNTNCHLPLLGSSLTRLLPYLYSFLSCRDQGVHAWVIRKVCVCVWHTRLLDGGRSDQPVACHSCQCIK